ncbi:MAG TPA: tripartite tricarboxylate transporter substrate binding protein [Ramlibacter sp.]|jgi:tripartite-type tricarboxylate transporter receptor subunit TctC|uniref:Bug family tripartite tricarboxylate transporter substrate binding protein n=1 Tax=Ramlibacter sp. TaxID=1917967 RepID=UPI002D7108B5|nr:tripartite tricarboxylate transporter substrate binding protein [Ramlibacter sp.]HZY17788.1 tripartite tricarboxylate transporter substrate binding protein [Ramlibacter sp.]
MNRRHFLSTVAAAAAVTSPWARAQGQYPDQPVKWVVPYPAGGGTDNLARAIAEGMRAGLGQSIVIDNRPGAATNIGAELVARARPDGYTIMSADNALMFLNEHLFKKLPFSPEKDFSYIGGIGRFPLALVVHPSFPAQDFRQLLAYVRANPGKTSYASVGLGSPHHLAMELFKNRTQSFITHIPYRGAAPAMQDVMGGQVPMMFLDLASGLSVIQSGKVRALAIGSPQRSAVLPNVPTLAEMGVKDAEVFAVQGVVGPAGLPAPVVGRLNQELNKALADPAVLSRFTGFGFEPIRVSPEQFKAMMRDEARRWGPVIRAANVTLD